MQQSMPGSDAALSLDSTADGGGGPFAALLLQGSGRPATGVVLLHGRNGNPDSAVVGPMRRSLNAAGYTTLSLQNPVPEAGDEFPNYVADLQGANRVFPEAFARIRAALRELAGLGISRAVLLGFSMGARMQSAFLAQGGQAAVPIVGFAALSNGVNGIGPLDSRTTLGKVSVPVLDVSGAGDADVAAAAEDREAAYRAGPGSAYTQVLVGNNAPHNFAGAEPELERRVVAWIATVAPLGTSDH